MRKKGTEVLRPMDAEPPSISPRISAAVESWGEMAINHGENGIEGETVYRVVSHAGGVSYCFINKLAHEADASR